MYFQSLLAALLLLGFGLGGNFVKSKCDVAPIVIPPFNGGSPNLPLPTIDDTSPFSHGIISGTFGPASVGVTIQIEYPDGSVISDIQIPVDPGNPCGDWQLTVYPPGLNPMWGSHVIRIAEIIRDGEGGFIVGETFEIGGLLNPESWTPPLGPNEF